MIFVEINGSHPDLTEVEIRNYIRSFWKKLLPRSHRSIYLTVEFSSTLFKEYGFKGSLETEDTPKGGKHSEFLMFLDKKLSKTETVECLAHELTHAKQYASGQMVDTTVDKVLWEGKSYDLRKIKYWDRPWEVEAYGMEVCLVNSLCDK